MAKASPCKSSIVGSRRSRDCRREKATEEVFGSRRPCRPEERDIGTFGPKFEEEEGERR